jgi:ATP/ADP translocase
MLRSFAEIRPDERRGAAAAFLSIFGVLAGHTLLETARDALFLSRLPASQLPWVYLTIAVLAVAVAQSPLSRVGHLTGRYGLALLLTSAAAATFAFWAFGSWTSRWELYALYVWTGLVGTLTALQLWLVLGEIYTVTQAKRIFRVVATGSLLGAVAGSWLARLVTQSFPAQHLVVAAAIVFALTGLGPAFFLRMPERGAPATAGLPSLRQAMRVVRAQPYVKGLAGLVLISTVALTLADYVFKSAVSRAVPPADLGTFFATFYIVLTGWLLRVLGLHRSLWALPVLLFFGAAGVALGGGLGAAMLLKGADGTLRHSLHRTGTELLFVPLPDAQRGRVKPFIDIVGQRGGQAIASLLILSEVVLQRGDAVVAGAAAALCLIWIAWAADLRPHYLDLFRTALRQGSIRDRADLPALDLGSLEALFAAMNSQDDGEVVGALDLLAEEGRTRLIPALILYHPSSAVVLRALDLFAESGRTDFVPITGRLLAHPDPELRAAALRARSVVKAEEQILRPAMEDPSPLVRATAVAGLVSGGWITDEAQKTLDELLESGSLEARRALARAIRHQAGPVFEEVLLRLAQDPDEEVLTDVAIAMGEVRGERFLPALLGMLDQHEVRAAARAAMLAIGPSALSFLDEALSDRAYPHELRRHLPRTISQFPPRAAAAVLLEHLLVEPDGMVRFKILRGLGRLAADHPDLELDTTILRQATDRTVEAAFRLLHWSATLAEGAAADPRRVTAGHELLAALLRDKEVHAVERLMRLLALQLRREDFKSISRGLRSGDPKVRASSRELLENVLRPPLRDAVIALVDSADEVPDAGRLAAAGPYYQPVALDYEGLLATILEHAGESLRCIVAYHVGELGLSALRGRLESQRKDAGFFLSRVVERALALLARPEGERLAHA